MHFDFCFAVEQCNRDKTEFVGEWLTRGGRATECRLPRRESWLTGQDIEGSGSCPSAAEQTCH